jgi:sortase (surface protein transpeptidase)
MNLSHILIRLAQQGVVAFCALLALLALLGTQALPASAATAPSFIRLIDASPDVGTVDVFVDGAKFLSKAQYGSVTDYQQLPAGPHKVQLALIGKGTRATVLVEKLSVQAGSAYTVAAIGTKSSGISLRVFVDDNRMVSGMATVRVYDLSPRSGALSVTTRANTLIGLVSYRQASNYQSLAAGQYTFTFSSSQPPVTFMDQVTLKTGTVTSLFLVGLLHGTPPLLVIHVQVKGLPRLLAATGGDPNALTLKVSNFASLIALPLGVLALTGIALAWFTRFWPFSRQKGRVRPRKLFGAALGAILALALSLGGLSFASLLIRQAPAPSAHLLIPAIGVNAIIETVSIQHNGAMDTPRQSAWDDVGLYSDGPRPGAQGSAVIAGHLDRPGGNRAVFWRLSALQVGDEVQFVDTHSKTLLFHVTRIEAYPVQDAPIQEIFGNTNGRFLNLTTCTGDWIPSQHQRAMRLVVYTSFGPAPANTSSVTSNVFSSVTYSSPLILPSSSSHAAHSPAARLSSLNSPSSTAMPSSNSSLVSSAITQTPLPAAIRQPVTVKLPGISQQVSRQLIRTPVVGTVLQQASKQLTRLPVVGTVLHQASNQLPSTSTVGKTLQQASSQLPSTSTVGKTLQQVSSQLPQTSVVGKTLQQTSSQVPSTSTAGQTVQQTSTQQPSTSTAGQSLQQTSTQQISSQVPSTSTAEQTVQQTSTQSPQTSTVGQSLQQVQK